MVLVTPEGYVHPDGAQRPINLAGFYIHSAIHKARPEAVTAAHCHSIHARTWSVFGRPIDIVTQDSCVFYNNLSVYRYVNYPEVPLLAYMLTRIACRNFGGIVLAAEEGKRIAEALGPKNKAVLLQVFCIPILFTTYTHCLSIL